MKTLRLIAALALAPLAALAQNQNVTQQIATKRVNSDISIGSGRAITVESGGSITISSGATTSGILSNASLAGLPTGIATITTGTGAINTLSTSAGVSAVISDETGTGALVFGTSPAFTTNFTFANGATPSTATVAQVAFDTDAWAASRGALQIYDGTANTYVVAVLASDTPTNGQFPRWNTGGTITWETPSSGSGDVVGPGSSTDNSLARFDSTTGKLIQNSSTTLSDAGAFAFADDVEQVFNPGSTNAGLNVGSLSGDPSSPSNGALWYDSASNELTARINGSNVALGAGGGGMTNPMTTSQDIIVGGSSGTPGRLGVGSNGQVLKVTGGSIVWDTDSTGSGSLPGSPTEGDLAYYDGADWVSLGIGTAGQVLKTNGTADAPVWGTDSTGGGGGGKTISIFTPRDGEFPASNYATLYTRNNRSILQFDTTTQETVYFPGIIPEGTDLTGGLTFYVRWAAETATSGTIGWDISVERIAAAGLDIDSDSFSTAQTITAATVSGTSGITSVTSVSISQANLPASLAPGDMYRVRVRRDVSNDTATGDAELLTLEIQLP